jgi:nitroreductase
MMGCPDASATVAGRGVSAADLMPLPPPKAKPTADALSALLESRRSVRRFSSDEVPAEALARIVSMASTAPMGIPPWDFGCVAVRGRAQVQALAREIVAGYRQIAVPGARKRANPGPHAWPACRNRCYYRRRQRRSPAGAVAGL